MGIEFLNNINGLEEALSSLHITAFPEGQGWKPKDFIELLAISFHHILIDYDSENKIRGFLVYSVILGEAEILTFCVSPYYQKKGVGSKIMMHFFKKMKELQIQIIFLEVAENNIFALALYNRFDFSSNGRRSKYYNNKIDALLMIKKL